MCSIGIVGVGVNLVSRSMCSMSVPMHFAVRCFCVLLSVSFSFGLSANASDGQASAAFMIVSGISATEEFCLSVENGARNRFASSLIVSFFFIGLSGVICDAARVWQHRPCAPPDSS